jgi:hypothetical protein
MVTMTDPQCVNTYVNELRFNVLGRWQSQTPAQRGAAMHQAVTRVHKMCGVPETTSRVAPIGQSHGLFQFSRWEIEMNTSLFPDAAVDVNNIHQHFVYVAEILYHEARHCEQWWHMARYLASNARSSSFLAGATQSPVFNILMSGSPVLTQEGAVYMTKKLGIPNNIARKSLDHPMKGQDPMRQLIEGWYKSVYGESNRGAVLRALCLNRGNVPGEQPILLQNFRNNIHQKYSGGLPEEKDAWGIQELIRQAFRRYQRA